MKRENDRWWEWVTRRLFVLGDYGYGIDLMSNDIDNPEFLTDGWLEAWFGADWAEKFVLDELNAVDLLMSNKSG